MKKILVILVVMFCSGCASLPNFTSGQAPKIQESWSKDVVPVAVGEVNGKQVAMYETHVAVNREAVGVKKPFLQRVYGWFIGLGVIGGMLAFFFPTLFFGVILWLMNKWKKLKEAYELHKTALEETVAGIKSAGLIVKDSPQAKIMDDTTSQSTKTLVGQIRATL